jgi:hypothetical protein
VRISVRRTTAAERTSRRNHRRRRGLRSLDPRASLRASNRLMNLPRRSSGVPPCLTAGRKCSPSDAGFDHAASWSRRGDPLAGAFLGIQP